MEAVEEDVERTTTISNCKSAKMPKYKSGKAQKYKSVQKYKSAEKRRRLVEAVEEDVERSTTVASWYSYYSAGSTSEGTGVVGLDNGVTL